MLACIPTRGNAGLEDTVFDHFGSAPYFTLYDSDTGKITVLENRNAHHNHGTCHPMTQLKKYHIDSIVCSGIGKRAIEMQNSEGIKVYDSDKKTVQEVVEQIKNNDLTEVDSAKACKGHGQRQGFIHGSPLKGEPGTGSGQGPGMNKRGPRK